MVEKFDSNEVEDSSECIDMPLEVREKVEQLEQIVDDELATLIRMEKEINQVKQRYSAELAVLRQKTVQPIEGIPDFWSIVVDTCCPDEVYDYDVPALKSLRHVRSFRIEDGCPPSDYPDFDKQGILVEFSFDENEYFTNKVLYKYYQLSFDISMDQYLSDMNCVVKKIVATQIDWKEGKNLTCDPESPMTLNDTEDPDPADMIQPTFFSFFDQPNEEFYQSESEELMALLAHDLRFGLLIHEQMIPKAVHFFTGRAQPPNGDMFDNMGMDSSDDEDDENDDESGTDDAASTSSVPLEPKNHHLFAKKQGTKPDPQSKDANCNQQ